MSFTTLNGVQLQIPARGFRNWDQVMFNVTWTNIASHDHTGNPKGNQLVTGSFSNNAVSGAKIRLTNTEYLRGRNAANTADINVIRVTNTDTLELGATTTGSILNLTSKLNIVESGAGVITADGDIANNTLLGLQFRNNGVARTVASLDAVQIVTNKDIDGGTASNSNRLTAPKNTLANLTALTRKQATVVYDTTANRPMFDDGTNLRAFGSGAAGRNYFESYFDFSVDPLSGAANNQAIGGNRTTGQGFWVVPTATAALLMSYDTSTPLRPPGSLVMTLAGGGGNQFVETPMFTPDLADTLAGTVLDVRFDSQAGATFANGDIDLVIVRYNSAGTFQELTAPSTSAMASGAYQFLAKFLPTATAGDQYAIRFRSQVVGSRTLEIDSLFAGPSNLILGPAISSYRSYTPVLFGGTNGLQYTNNTVVGFFRRVGDSVNVTASIAFSGAPGTGTGSFRLTLPPGVSIDTTKINGVGAFFLGVGLARDSATATNPLCAIQSSSVFSGASSVEFIQINAGSVDAVSPTQPFSFGASDNINISFVAPVVGWDSNVSLQSSFTEFTFNTGTWDASDATNFGYGAVGQLMGGALAATRDKRVRFQNPIQPTDVLILEFNISGTNNWVSQSSFGGPGGTSYSAGIFSASAAAGNAGAVFTRVSGSQTDVDVTFLRYRFMRADGTGLGDWENTVRWRLRKSSGNNPGEVQRTLFVTAHRAGTNQTGIATNSSSIQLLFNSVTSTTASGITRGGGSLSGFSAANSNFVAPISGLYRFDLSVALLSTNVLADQYFATLQVGASFAAANVFLRATSQAAIASVIVRTNVNGVCQLNAGDTVWMALFGRGNNSVSTLTMAGTIEDSYFNVEYVGPI